MEIINIVTACVASVSARVRREKLGREQEKRNAPFFFCSRSNFRAIPRLETLATQANIVSAHLSV